MLKKWWFVLLMDAITEVTGKGKGISLHSIPNPSIKTDKKELAGRLLFMIGKDEQ